jgi:hypothetical protein
MMLDPVMTMCVLDLWTGCNVALRQLLMMRLLVQSPRPA